MSKTTMKQFKNCVDFSQRNGWFNYECVRGFWSVESKNQTEALNQAFHYFQQYKSDGEYHLIIGGPTPLDVLTGRI